MGVNLTSPRTEAIHAVQNQYFNNKVRKTPSWPTEVGPTPAFGGGIIAGMHGPTCISWASLTPCSLKDGHCEGCKTNYGESAARFGDYKIIISAGNRPCRFSSGHVAWPMPASEPVAFGLFTGWVLTPPPPLAIRTPQELFLGPKKCLLL
jgi:hypothetical protein